MSEAGRWGSDGPPPEAYSRVTNAERFRPLHAAMLDVIGRLGNDFDVERTEGYGLDEELERGLDLVRPCVRLSPRNPGAVPVAVVFSSFPGLHVRFGRWYWEPFPSCGCDACDESAEVEIERLTEMVDNVIAGRFREALRRPLLSFRGSGWKEAEFWSPVGRSSRRTRVDRRSAQRMSGGRRRVNLDWKPWRRKQAASLPACA